MINRGNATDKTDSFNHGRTTNKKQSLILVLKVFEIEKEGR